MKPTLEEVKEHFKDARVVRCLGKQLLHNVIEDVRKYIEPRPSGYWMETEEDNVLLFKNGKYAEIVEYINPIKEMTFTLEQIAKHGELIMELAKDPTILIEKKQSTGWLLATKPRFDVNTEYRKRPVPFFVNELGEQFTQEDLKNKIRVFAYSFKRMEVVPIYLDSLTTYGGGSSYTSISKTELGALKLAVKHLENGKDTDS